MKNYIQNAVRTLFAGLFLLLAMVGIQIQADAENSALLNKVEQAAQVVATQEAVSEPTDLIRIRSEKFEPNGAVLLLAPCVYSLQGAQGIYFGAPELGYNKATLTRLNLSGEFSSIAHKRVAMNGGEGQLNPIYNKKITHLSIAAENLINVVVDGQPDTVYRYSQFDQQNTAKMSAHKVTNGRGTECVIKRLASGVLGGNEYVVAHVVSTDAPHEVALYFIKSYIKNYTINLTKNEPQVAPAEVDEDETKDSEAEQAKKIEQKTISKHIFAGIDPLTGSEVSVTAIPLGALLESECLAYASWDISDLQIRDNKLYIEMRNPLSDEYTLLVSKLTQTKCRFTELRPHFIYHKNALVRTSAWQQEPSFVLLTAGRAAKKYCIVVGSLYGSADHKNSVLALPLDEKESAVPTVVGGASVLPGPIAALQRTNETVYVAVTNSYTKEAPGLFYSQAILDGNGSIASWSSWQRAGGSYESVIGIYSAGFTVRKLSLYGDDKKALCFHTPKWRGPALDAQEVQAEEKALKERKEREANKKYRDEQLEKRRQEALKKEKESGIAAPKPEAPIASQPEEKPDFNCVSNTGFAYGFDCKNEYESSDLYLSKSLTTLFEDLPGGIHALGDVPAATPGSASYLVAAGCKQVVIAPTHQAFKQGKPVARTYSENSICKDGSFKGSDPLDESAALYVCKGGVIEELGFIETIHCASTGNDQWLFIGSPRGVAVLATDAGAGFGMHSTNLPQAFSFKMLGSYEWVRQIISDDQFVYIVTEDRIDRIPLRASNFKANACLEVCTIATALDVGAVCDGYVINDACVSEGMIFVGTSRGLVVTAPGIDCRVVSDHAQVLWQKVALPTASDTISHLLPLSQTGHAYDVANKGQLFVVACSLFDDSSSVTRLFIDRSAEQQIMVVPDIHKKYVGSWINYSYRIGTFFTNGTIHLVSRDRFEDAKVALALMEGSTKRNQGNPQQLGFSDTAARVSTIMRSSASGTIFVTADDGVRIYE